MRSTPFIEVFNRTVRLHGRDPRKEVPEDMREALVDHINDRVRTIWQCWRWPEWELTEERAFRQVWNATHQYLRANLVNGQPDEVFYLGSPFVAGGAFGSGWGYYRVKSTAVADPPIGALPTNTLYFEVIENVDAFVAYDQGCKRSIGMVRGIYSTNPRANNCSHNGLLKYMPSEKGIDVRCGGVPTVFVAYSMPCPAYTMTPYVVGKTYARGSVVFDPATGECFQAIAVTSDVPSNPTFWRWIPFLDVWSDYVQKGSFADSLMEFDQGGNTEIQPRMVLVQYWNGQADDSLQAEVDALATQGQKLQYNFCVRAHGCWCSSEQWSGGSVTSLTDACEDELGWVYPTQPEVPGAVLGDEIRGVARLVEGLEYLDVVFGVTLANLDWILVEASVVNTTDLAPLNVWAGIISARSLTGFRLQLNGLPDSNNYYLHWAVREVTSIGLPAPAYTMTGPSSGGNGVAATFTIELPVGLTVAAPVTVTLSDVGGGGAFSPTTVVLTNSDPVATFTYTPASYGAKSISATNDGGLTDPASVYFVVSVSTYTLNGPSTGTSGVASTNFTVAFPVGGVITGSVTVTPSSGGGGGTFTPSTVSLTTAAPSATFTYTPASAGTKTVSTTNNRGLTDPAGISYVATVPFGDGSSVSSWLDSSTGGHNATQTGSARPTYKTNIINGKPVVRFTSAGTSSLHFASAITGTGNYTAFAVAKRATDTATLHCLSSSSDTTMVLTQTELSGHLIGSSNNGTQFGYNNTLSTAAFAVFTGQSTGGALTLFYNGTSIAVTGFALAGSSVNVIGARTSDGNYSDGDIAEIIIYNASISGTDRANVEKYLGVKYGLTVAGGSAVQPDTVTGLVGWWKADAGLS